MFLIPIQAVLVYRSSASGLKTHAIRDQFKPYWSQELSKGNWLLSYNMQKHSIHRQRLSYQSVGECRLM